MERLSPERLTILHPAPLIETRLLADRLVGLKAPLGQALAYQLAEADVWGFAVGGRLLAVMGFFPIGTGAEVFLIGAPAPVVAPHMVRLARAARLILLDKLHSGTVPLVGLVRLGHEPGRRLARLAGFAPGDGAPSGFERWERWS